MCRVRFSEALSFGLSSFSSAVSCKTVIDSMGVPTTCSQQLHLWNMKYFQVSVSGR